MIQIKSERKSSQMSVNILNISFHLKQCTVFHNKFGCYSFDLRYGNTSKRSPTINILKEKVNLDVILSFQDVPKEGQDIIISLYNQILIKNKQNDVLISQQILKLSDFQSNKKTSQTDQFLTFEQDGSLKAQAKYNLQVKDLGEELVEEEPRKFINLLREWMRDQFLQQIINKVENEEKEDRLKKLKQQQEELLKKKKEEEDSKRKQKEQEEMEKKKIEKQKKLEELNRLKQLKEERESREKEKQKKEEEEKEKQRLLKQQQKEERIKQKQREQEQIEEMRKKKQLAEENELKQYEEEGFEEEQEQQKKKENIKPSDITKDSQKRQSNNEDILEELIEETEEVNTKYKSQGQRSNQKISRQPKSRQISYFDGYYNQRGQSRESSKEKSFLDKSGVKQRSATKIDKRNYMALLKQWMSKFLKKIIRQTSFVDQLNLYTSSFYIFGDETFPYIIIFDSLQQKLDRISLPKSLTMYRYSSSVSLPNGKIFICGGVNSKLNNIQPLCQLYDPYLNKGYPLPNMNYARYTHSSIYFHDYVYVLGGRTYGSGEASILNSFERFSLKNNKWEKLAQLQNGRCTASLIGLQDKKLLYLVGGFSPKGRLNQVERYNIQENTWQILNIKLPLSVEAGITFSLQGSSDTFYYMFGRGDEDRNEQIFKIQINPQNSEQDRVDLVGRVKKSRVLPNYFIDDQQKLYVFGGDENTWERFELPSFDSRFGKKCNTDILPIDMKMFCSAQSYIEKPRKPALTGVKDAFYIHIVVLDLDLSIKQFKSGKEQSNSKSNKIQLQRPINNQSCQLINSNYLFLFGGEYIQNAPQTPIINKDNSKAKLPQKQQQQQQEKLLQNQQQVRFSKESYIFSLNTQQILQLSPSLTAKRNAAVFFINQMIYSFGGEQVSQDEVIVSQRIERFHLKQNKWERMADLQYPISLSSVFIYDSIIYLLGGINNEKKYNNLVLKYNLQYDFSMSSRHTLPIEFKHTIQFFDNNKSPTQFVLLFSASFKQQGIYNLLTGSFQQIELVSQQSYLNDEKRVLRVAQEKEVVSFILPNKIDLFRVSIDQNQINQGGFPQFTISNIKQIALQGGKQPQNVQKEQVVPIRNIFMTRYVDRRMEFYDFIEFNENRRVLRTSSSSNGQNINSANNLDDPVTNGLQVLPQQNIQNDQITCMYEDNEGNIKLVKQEITTGYEEDVILISTNSQNNNQNRIEKRSVMSYQSDSQKIILTGGIDGNMSIGHIIELDINKRKIQKIQEMITPRYHHCQIIVGHYLYMIGGCTTIQSSSSTNNSPSLQKLQQMTSISKSQSSSLVFDKQVQLQKNNSEQQKTQNTSAVNSNKSILLKNEKTPQKNTKGQSQSTSSITKLVNQSANKNNQSISNQSQYLRQTIENIPSEDEDVEDQNRNIDNTKDEIYFSQQSRLNQQFNRSNYLQSGQNRGQGNTILSILKKVDRLNLKTNEIEQLSDLPIGLMHSSCCEIKGVIYVIGGKDTMNSCVDSIFKYEIHSNIWQITQCKLWQPIHSVSCIAAGYNQILVFGGVNSVENGVKDIQVIDIKTSSTKKIAASSIDNLSPLLFSHTSQKSLVGKEIFLFDKNHIQCIDIVSNFDSFLVKEITPIQSLQNIKDTKQIYGIFSNKLLDNSAISIQSHFSLKQYDTFTIFGNEKNPIQIQYDMKVLKYKVSESQPNNFQLLQSSSACCIEQDNSILISGGMDSEQIYSTIFIYKNYQISQNKSINLSIPRFQHASIYYENKIYFIGGKSYSNQNKLSKSQPPYSYASTASSNSPNSTQYSDDKQTKYACISECEVLDLASQQITKIAQLNFPRSNIQAVLLMDNIYVFAGFGGDKRLRSIERFIISQNKWEIVDCYLNSDLENYQLCKISPFEVLIVGGKENGVNSSKIFIFNAKFHTLTISNIKLTYDFTAFKCTVYNEDLFVFGNHQNQPLVVSYNLRNGYEDSKLPNVQQLSLMDFNWSSILTKSY